MPPLNCGEPRRHPDPKGPDSYLPLPLDLQQGYLAWYSFQGRLTYSSLLSTGGEALSSSNKEAYFLHNSVCAK